MPDEQKQCHGQFDCMVSGSDPLRLGFMLKKWWRLRNIPIHGFWHLRTKGVIGTLKVTIWKFLKIFGIKEKTSAPEPIPLHEEVLNLEPGELVEIKSEQEIMSMLDENKRYKGLYFMGGMRKYCGGRYRVYKRVERILLETNEELRKLKNTVLLEGVMCDGQVWSGCDRSCFYYWREAWLRRVKED